MAEAVFFYQNAIYLKLKVSCRLPGREEAEKSGIHRRGFDLLRVKKSKKIF